MNVRLKTKLEDNAEKVSPVYKLSKADFAYIKVMGEFWFDTSYSKALTSKEARRVYWLHPPHPPC